MASPLPPPSPRAHLQVRALLAALLEERPTSQIARIVERVATAHDDRLEEDIRFNTWCHAGFAELISDLATRLVGQPNEGFCAIVGCGANAIVSLPDGQRMCAQHAAVLLLTEMDPEKALNAWNLSQTENRRG